MGAALPLRSHVTISGDTFLTFVCVTTDISLLGARDPDDHPERLGQAPPCDGLCLYVQC
ncbi:rCG42019 [Rattus norvegicus]|uniref:RCG42019 n=1 Tax=Rattus norvegicus TaxID=10116 RepID=A6JV11_RAT|nr:rCG42019 [Rattus norvegicus]